MSTFLSIEKAPFRVSSVGLVITMLEGSGFDDGKRAAPRNALNGVRI